MTPSVNGIKSSIKIDKPLVVYRFWKRYVLTTVITSDIYVHIGVGTGGGGGGLKYFCWSARIALIAFAPSSKILYLVFGSVLSLPDFYSEIPGSGTLIFSYT